MTTVADLRARVRLEIGDQLELFQSTVEGYGDGTVRYELPNSPVTGVTAFTTTNGTPTTLAADTDYELDAANGVITLTTPLALGTTLTVRGTSGKYFSDDEYDLFINTAVAQHLHNRQGVTLTTLPVVEEYPVALLAAIEALYALLNDAAFDIDVSTPEGVGIPRSQRFKQLQEMIDLRKQQYSELCGALNVGLNRIEVFTLRRVSRTTNRLVPVFLPQEVEDRQPPTRVFAPIDTGGAAAIEDGIAVQDITMYEYGYYTEQVPIPGGIPAGFKVDARIRRYKDSSSLREFTVTDNGDGTVQLDLTPQQTGQMPVRVFYDIRLTNKTTREVRMVRRGAVTIIQQVGVDESVGPVSGPGW